MKRAVPYFALMIILASPLFAAADWEPPAYFEAKRDTLFSTTVKDSEIPIIHKALAALLWRRMGLRFSWKMEEVEESIASVFDVSGQYLGETYGWKKAVIFIIKYRGKSTVKGPYTCFWIGGGAKPGVIEGSATKARQCLSPTPDKPSELMPTPKASVVDALK